MLRRRRGWVVVLCWMMFLVAGSSSNAEPGQRVLLTARCGQTIQAPRGMTAPVLVLQNDIGPCPGDGLIIKSSNLTLDLNGHSIVGKGVRAGIVVRGKRGISIINRQATGGIIENFDLGVFLGNFNGTPTRSSSIEGVRFQGNVQAGVWVDELASENTIAGNDFTGADHGVELERAGPGNVIRRNVIQAADFGVGIFQTDGTLVEGNRITGCIVGIEILGSDDSIVRDNVVDSNTRHGIRVDTGEVQMTPDPILISSNVVTNNGTGIALIASNSEISGNDVSGNSLDGILIGPERRTDFLLHGNVVRGNTVRGNGRNGINIMCTTDPSRTSCVASDQSNLIVGNVATGNGGASAGVFTQDAGFLTGNFDLLDGNSASNPGSATPCGTNVWSSNVFEAAFPSCTTG